jgi:hypothetical protein
MTVENTEDKLQRAAYILNNTAIKYNSKILIDKTRAWL